jgi:IS5 family transposase
MRFCARKQQTLAMAADQGGGFERYRRATKRDVFLATMHEIVPWQALCELIEPHYPKPGSGRSPVGLQRMLRMYFVQHWFNLADEACEEALLDSTELRRSSWVSTWVASACPTAPRC